MKTGADNRVSDEGCIYTLAESELKCALEIATKRYLVPIEIIGKRCYKLSEVKTILNGGRR